MLSSDPQRGPPTLSIWAPPCSIEYVTVSLEFALLMQKVRLNFEAAVGTEMFSPRSCD